MAIQFLEPNDGEVKTLDYLALDREIRHVASWLRSQRLVGKRVLLLYPSGIDFVVAFWACLYAGVIAVPVVLPGPGSRQWRRVEGIALDADAIGVLSTKTVFEEARSVLHGSPVLSRLSRWASDQLEVGEKETYPSCPDLSQTGLAFLQYTSGSTSAPKGVRVTHEGLMHNHRLMVDAYQVSQQDVFVTWLPLFHDLGLIGNLLQAHFLGATLVAMAPETFLQRPRRWLEAISRYRGTVSFAPNFGYELCVRRLSEAEKQGLELSSWRVAVNGAEPVRERTLDRFASSFSRCGFRPEAATPAYGLAEATLTVAVSAPGRLPKVLQLSAEQYRDGRVRPAAGGEEGLSQVSVGEVAGGQIVRIVDPETALPCSADQVGEIWISGPSVADGYWRNADASSETFRARLGGPSRPAGGELADGELVDGEPVNEALVGGEPAGRGPVDEKPAEKSSSGVFLRTGDLGFLHEGELFISGRVKDLIVLRGRNLHPQDLELSAGEVDPALRPGRGACFSIDHDDQEAPVMVQEVRHKAIEAMDVDRISNLIRRVVLEDHGVELHAVILIPARTLPRTSSGKVQRFRCRELYLSGGLKKMALAGEIESKAKAVLPGARAPLGIEQEVDGSGLVSRLRRMTAAAAGLPVEAIDPTVPVARYGFGSQRLVELTGTIAEELNCSLSPTLFFRHPTLLSLARWFSREGLIESGLTASRKVSLGETEDVLSSQRALEGAIAIVGIGCRFPGGVEDRRSFWDFLCRSGNAVVPVPSGRWKVRDFYSPEPGVPGKTVSRWGSFVEGIDRFDPGFFGISPAEAQSLDPQQRLLLETGWHALEDAGEAPADGPHRRSGVFVGVSTHDYSDLALQSQADAGVYASTGTATSLAANRLSYHFDLRGPSLSVDTACSSSLVAVHLACRSLLSGECNRALAGGVQLMLQPGLGVSLSRAGMLSPRGRCKTFDAEADGYVRGEGCGLVVLRRLDDAQRDGARVLAVIRGSAVNQDGRSNGLTAPNGKAQEALLEEALAVAGVEPGTVDYVEAHGTGTPLGDPIEIEACDNVYRRGREGAEPLLVGSVKTNLGHLEAAAGVAGLIKTVLGLYHGEIPAHLGLEVPNPHLPWERMAVEVTQQHRSWPRRGGRRRAGVSSFGFGGTNAHLVLEQAPSGREDPSKDLFQNGPVQEGLRQERLGQPDREETHENAASLRASPSLLAISAASPAALRDLARRHGEMLRAPASATRRASSEADFLADFLADYCNLNNRARSALAYRAAFVAEDSRGMVRKLEAFLGGSSKEAVAELRAAALSPPEMVWLFSGQGDLSPGAGRSLYGSQPVFRRALDECAAVLDPIMPIPLSGSLLEPETEALEDPACSQPAHFALQVALAQLWMSWGLRPSKVLGHSLGEYAAAWVAGVFSLEDALRLVAARGRHMSTLPNGNMATITASLEEISPFLEGRSVEAAAFNTLRQTVITGRPGEMLAVTSALEKDGYRCQPLEVNRAYHSADLEAVLPSFAADWEGVKLSLPHCDFVSSLTGQGESTALATVQYWMRQAREPVLFHKGFEELMVGGAQVALELGPGTALSAAARHNLRDCHNLRARQNPRAHHDLQSRPGPGPTILPSLRPGRAERQLLETAGRLFELGVEPRWENWGEAPKAWPELPHYPFQKLRFWIPSQQQTAAPCYEIAWQEKATLPLLSNRRPLSATLSEVPWESLDLQTLVRARQALDVYAINMARHSLEKLGWIPEVSQLSCHELGQRLKVPTRHHRLLKRLSDLASEGPLDSAGKMDRSTSKQASGETTGDGGLDSGLASGLASALDCGLQLETLQREFPALAPHCRLVHRCGEALHEVLLGTMDAVEVLFPGGDDSLLANLYREPTVLEWNRRLTRWLQAIVSSEGRPTRILEIGAGTGATTEVLLEGLGARCFEYLMTDISPVLLRSGREKFGGQGVEFATFDVERSPAAQGLGGRGFDVVLASNVLHGTKNLPRSLRHIRQLLRPGGVVLLLETVERLPWLDLTFGLTEGWWSFDDGRGDHGLLDAAAWREQLEMAGFSQVTTANAEGGLAGSGMALLAGQADGSFAVADSHAPDPGWLVAQERSQGEELVQALEPLGGNWQVVLPTEIDQLNGSPHSCIYLEDLSPRDCFEDSPGSSPDCLSRGGEAFLQLTRALRRSPLEGFGNLFVVTRGGVPPVGAEDPISLAAAVVVGLAAGVELEHPEWSCRCIDVDGASGWALQVATEIQRFSGEQQVVYRQARCWAPRLREASTESAAHLEGDRGTSTVETPPIETPPVKTTTVEIHSDGQYLITGGLGRLGLQLARWLVDQGARHLCLLSRRSAPEEESEEGQVLRTLRKRGTRLTLLRGDVGDRDSLESALTPVLESGASPEASGGSLPLRGIFHLAGVGGRSSVSEVTKEELQAAIWPKALGAWNLHRWSQRRGLDLDLFVAFSSAAAVWGARHQAHYGAANRCLDQLIHLRRQQGLPGLTVNWGYLAGGGMVTDEDHRWYRQLGLHPLPLQPAFDRMLALLGSGRSSASSVSRGQATVAKVDWQRFDQVYQVGSQRRLLSRLVSKEPGSEIGPSVAALNETASSAASLPAKAGLATPDSSSIRSLVARSLGIPEEELVEEEPLQACGFDSLMAVELSNRLQQTFGIATPVSRLLTRTSLGDLMTFLQARVPTEEGAGISRNTEESVRAAEKAAETAADASADASADLRSETDAPELVAAGVVEGTL